MDTLAYTILHILKQIKRKMVPPSAKKFSSIWSDLTADHLAGRAAIHNKRSSA